MKMVSNISGMEDQTDVLEPANGENAMDQYLQSIGLYRKPVAKDGSCLFRAVAEKVLLLGFIDPRDMAYRLNPRNLKCVSYFLKFHATMRDLFVFSLN